MSWRRFSACPDSESVNVATTGAIAKIASLAVLCWSACKPGK